MRMLHCYKLCKTIEREKIHIHLVLWYLMDILLSYICHLPQTIIRIKEYILSVNWRFKSQKRHFLTGENKFYWAIRKANKSFLILLDSGVMCVKTMQIFNGKNIYLFCQKWDSGIISWWCIHYHFPYLLHSCSW